MTSPDVACVPARRLRLLVVEDAVATADALREGLRSAGYEVVVETTGSGGLARASSEAFDILILDLTLPQLDGLQVIRALRRQGNSTPVVVVSGRDSIDARVAGLEAGADDYLPKPFALPELLARLRALSRRAVDDAGAVLRFGMITVEPLGRVVRIRGERIELSQREFDLLLCLVRHQGKPVTRDAIAKEVWQARERSLSFDNIVDVYVRRLRKKLGPAADYLKTLRGVGFLLERNRRA